MRYAFQRNTTDRWGVVNHFDNLPDAIAAAAEDSRRYRPGTAEHRVIDVVRDSIKYRRGWIDRDCPKYPPEKAKSEDQEK